MTINLKTGREYPPDPLDYITKVAGTELAPPGTPCPLWLKFLSRVTAINEEIIAFLQRFLGYSMTGEISEHSLVFLFGTGANGKGVFTSTITEIMGTYAIIAPMEMFVVSHGERHPTEIAKLRGARLVIAHETQKGRRWDESKLKTLTGGDKLTGRFMRGDFFDFKPTHKFLIEGNHKPSFSSVDEAIRRRVLLVPFTVCIPEAERDTKLIEKLRPEHVGESGGAVGCLAGQPGCGPSTVICGSLATRLARSGCERSALAIENGGRPPISGHALATRRVRAN